MLFDQTKLCFYLSLEYTKFIFTYPNLLKKFFGLDIKKFGIAKKA